jgi:N-acetylmuramoyl-L-alanine amidase
VINVRYWTAPTRVRVVVDLTSQVIYHVKQKVPEEIIIKLEHTRTKRHYLDIDNNTIKEIVVSQVDENTTCIKMVLVKKTDFCVFQLKKYQYKPDRLVIDVKNPDVKKEIVVSEEELKRIKERAKIVVIDPGHGGEDPGAIGKSGLQEKDVVFSIATKLKEYFDKHENVKTFLTRNGDYFIPLGQRVKLCKAYKGDIFISIHTDANFDRSKHGSSVYVLSTSGATDKAAQLVAQRENMADLIGGIATIEDDTVAGILLDLSQTQAINESLVLAELVMDKIVDYCDMFRIGVKRAGFAVLKSIDVPSILVETAFISNPREERLLSGDTFRSTVAKAIYDATMEYLELQPSVEEEEVQYTEVHHTRMMAVPEMREKEERREEKKYSRYHIVQKGETLWRISKLYGISVEKLKELNGISADNLLRVGQKLIIP